MSAFWPLAILVSLAFTSKNGIHPMGQRHECCVNKNQVSEGASEQVKSGSSQYSFHWHSRVKITNVSLTYAFQFKKLCAYRSLFIKLSYMKQLTTPMAAEIFLISKIAGGGVCSSAGVNFWFSFYQ